jgi:hypothetical protein
MRTVVTDTAKTPDRRRLEPISRAEREDSTCPSRIIVCRSGRVRCRGEPSARWLALYDEATVAAIAGRLADAEVLASEALEIATDSGEPDALSLYASQLTNIRYEQGRLAELQPMIAETAADNPGIPSFRALLALAYLEGELPLEAAELLAAERPESLPRDMTWLACVVLWARVCASVGDAARAESLYALLEPYADQVVYTGISAWGDVDHALGRLATVTGRHEDAARHLAAATAQYGRIGAPVWLARAALDEASLVLARGEGYAALPPAGEGPPGALPAPRSIEMSRLGPRYRHSY